MKLQKWNLRGTLSRMWFVVSFQLRSAVSGAGCKFSKLFEPTKQQKCQLWTSSSFLGWKSKMHSHQNICGWTCRWHSPIQSAQIFKYATWTNWVSARPHNLYSHHITLITAFFFFHTVSLTRISQEVSHSDGGWLDGSCDTVQESWRKQGGGGTEESSVTEIFTTSTRSSTWATTAVWMVCLRGNVAQCFEHSR